MAYRVYSGPRGSQSISPLEKDRHLYKEFSLLDEAMSWARHINDSGRVALLVEGDDGTRLTKQQIVTALKNPEDDRAAQSRGVSSCAAGGLSAVDTRQRCEIGNFAQRRKVRILIRHTRPIDPERVEAERHGAHHIPAVR